MRASISSIVLAGLIATANLGHAFPVELNNARTDLFAGRNYLSGFPEVRTRKVLRELYLGTNASNLYTDVSGRFRTLRQAAKVSVDYRLANPAAASTDLAIAQELAWQAVEAALQGQLVAGNYNLLKGTRVAYPSNSGGPERPAGETLIPVGSPVPSAGTAQIDRDDDGGYKGARIGDLMYAKSHFARGVILALDFIATDLTGKLRATESDNGLGTLFPQYTRFNESGDLADDGNFTGEKYSQTAGYLLGNILDRQGKAIVAAGERLWKAAYFDRGRAPGQARAGERQELLDAAQSELKKSAQFQYLASLPLAASLSDGTAGNLDEYELCRIDQARATVEQASVFIERIRRGEIPKLDSFELNHSRTDINSKITQAKTLQSSAFTKYTAAKDAIWKAKTAESEAISAAQQLRSQFTSQLALLTGLDPGLEGSGPFGGLITDVGRTSYRSDVYQKLANSILSNTATPRISDSSELGKAVLQVRRAEAQLRSAENRRDNVPQQIKIIEDREKATSGILVGTQEQISAYNLAMGEANATRVTVSAGVSIGLTGPSFETGVSVTHDPGAIKVANLQNKSQRAEVLKQIQINNVNAEAEIRNLLLQQNQHSLEVDECIIQLKLAFAEVSGLLARAELLIEDHNYYRSSNNSKWWSDPALMFEREKAELEYDIEHREYMQVLYSLTKMLEARWAEAFTNPLLSKAGSVTTLGVSYDNWSQPESIFNAKDRVDLDNYFLALQTWDNFLRTNRDNADTTYSEDVVVSLRQDILGWSDVKWDGSQFVLDTNAKKENLRRFQSYLLYGKRPGYQLWLEFPLVFDQSSRSKQGNLSSQPSVLQLFPGDWNARMTSLRVRMIGSNLTSITPYRIDLYQYGRVEVPRYFPRTGPRTFQNFNLPLYYSNPSEVLNAPPRYSLQVGIGAGSTPPVTPDSIIDAEPSPFCNRWMLLIPDPGSGPLNLNNLEDIELLVRLKIGRPATFNW